MGLNTWSPARGGRLWNILEVEPIWSKWISMSGQIRCTLQFLLLLPLCFLLCRQELSSAGWVFLLPWRHPAESHPCQDGPNHLTSRDKVNLSSFTLLLPDSLSSQTRKVTIWGQDINITYGSFLLTTRSLYGVQFLSRTSYWHGPMGQANCRHSISKHSTHLVFRKVIKM